MDARYPRYLQGTAAHARLVRHLEGIASELRTCSDERRVVQIVPMYWLSGERVLVMHRSEIIASSSDAHFFNAITDYNARALALLMRHQARSSKSTPDEGT